MTYKEQTTVEIDNEKFKISTIYDEEWHRYETMIFECDSYGDIMSWDTMYVDYYLTEEAAKVGHKDCVKNTKEKLNMGTINIWKQLFMAKGS